MKMSTERLRVLLIYSSFVMLPQSIQWVTTGILRGAGDIKYTARNSMISVTLVRPFFAYILCYPLGLGILGSWIGMLIDQSLRTVLNNHRFTRLKWMKIEV
jgi:Na+-driven multidrug efflux pump